MKTLHQPRRTVFAASALMIWLVACQSPSPKAETASMPDPTRLASIAVAAPDGTVVVLADRSTWVVDPDDRATAIRWRTADLVEAVSGPANAGKEFPAVLTNQESGSRIHARQSADFDG